MRVFLMLLGAAVSGGVLLFWIYLSELAAGWSTSNTKPSINWLTEEALLFFWLPFAIGGGDFARAFVGLDETK